MAADCEVGCELVGRLRDGDEAAWPVLVHRYAPLVRVVARSHRLSGVDTADAVQSTWTALAESLPRLTQPERLRAWLVTTARRECLRIRERLAQELPADAVVVGVDPGPEPHALRTVRDRVLWHAVGRLPDRCRRLVELQAHAPELTYPELARALNMSAGSVGRTRGRCLEHLRRLLAEQHIHADALD